MKAKYWIFFLLIAFFVGAIGSIVLGRFLIPYLATDKGWNFLGKLATNSPIVINRTTEVQLNEGVNLIDLSKQAGQITVSVYRGEKPQLTFAGLGTTISSDGLIFTSKSTVGASKEMTVVLNDGRSFRGLVRATDPKSDLAVMTIQASGLPVANFDSSLVLQAGQRLLTLGIANQAFDRQIKLGMVTGSVGNNKYLDQVFHSERLADTFKTDFVFNENYAGAPIVNLQGRLVGIVANDRNEIIISENLQTALTSYLQTGKITRPKLGMQYGSLSVLQANLKNLPRGGVVVLSVDKDSTAAKAGLRQNDLIWEVNGESLEQSDFEQVLNRQAADGTLKLKLLRAAKETEITVSLKPTE